MECAGRIILEGVQERLVDLHTRIHTGRYRAQPARRTTIPKADGSSRSLSIWCLEDKIAQQSVTTVLSAVITYHRGKLYWITAGLSLFSCLIEARTFVPAVA